MPDPCCPAGHALDVPRTKHKLRCDQKGCNYKFTQGPETLCCVQCDYDLCSTCAKAAELVADPNAKRTPKKVAAFEPSSPPTRKPQKKAAAAPQRRATFAVDDEDWSPLQDLMDEHGYTPKSLATKLKLICDCSRVDTDFSRWYW